MILHGNVLDLHVSASRKEDDSGRRGQIQSLILPAGPILPLLFYKTITIAINGSHARDGDVLAALGKDKRCVSVSGQVVAFHVGQPLAFGVIVAIGRAKKASVGLDMQLHTASQGDRAAQIGSLTHNHTTAALRRTIINGTLNRRRVHGDSVPHGTVAFDVKFSHAFSSNPTA